MALPVDRLVNDDRFCGDNVTMFLLYLPLGLILMSVRLLIGIVLWFSSLLLPAKSASRIISTMACATFGMHVKQRGSRDHNTSLIVANYVSAMDPLAAYYMLGTLSLRKWKVPPFFASALGIKNLAHFSAKQHWCQSRPLLVQPEGVATSGAGLLRFRDWPVPLPDRVQPLTVRVERMFTRVTVHSALDTPDSLPWSDLFWFLWTPATAYSLCLLPPVKRAPGEADDSFVERIRAKIGHSLKIEATEYTASDIIACARRGVRPPAAATPGAPGAAAGSGGRPDLNRLAQQVKEVLPRVPTRDILRDLARTRSVDVTITNFLEELTPYTPEDAQPSTSRAPRPPSPRAPRPPSPRTSPVAFPADPHLRQLSFQEKKAQMIATARRKYIEKHGLDAEC